MEEFAKLDCVVITQGLSWILGLSGALSIVGGVLMYRQCALPIISNLLSFLRSRGFFEAHIWSNQTIHKVWNAFSGLALVVTAYWLSSTANLCLAFR